MSFEEWMGGESEGEDDRNAKSKGREDFDKIFADDKFSKREKKGHMLLQLQKTYKGDARFKLNKDYDVDQLKHLPSSMLGSLSTREYQDFITAKKQTKRDNAEVGQGETVERDPLDEGEFLWDTELGQMKSEKSKAFSVLAQFVPQSEIFFNHMSASKPASQ